MNHVKSYLEYLGCTLVYLRPLGVGLTFFQKHWVEQEVYSEIKLK